MACNFIAVLSKLRKLSMESVENTASFDDFKKYLHVLRPVEEELRSLLNRVNAVNKKTLILLCGSAGDGKSHLLSYVRNADSANLLNGCYVKKHLDNRVDLIAVIAPQYFDNSFKGTLRFLAKLGGKKVMFIELDDVARLIEGNSAIDV